MRATTSVLGVAIRAVGLVILVLPLVVSAPPLHGQVATPTAAGQSPGSQTVAEPPPSQALEPYSYNPGGRRDPFVSLQRRGIDRSAAGVRPSGLPGLMVDEVSVRGVVQSQNAYLAMLQGPDGRTYLVRARDRLLDGSVASITADTVVFLQEVKDPLSLVTQREVSKPLRPLEENR